MQELFGNLWNLQWQQVVMWGIGGLLIWLAIKKEMEPSLLLPMGFGAILVNLPLSGAVTQVLSTGTEVGPLDVLFDAGIANELFPLLLFVGIGAMIDFTPLLSNPKLMIFGAAAQFGIFFTTREFEEKLFALIQFLLPQYVQEGKSQLMIGVGCTGGRHRSVFIANQLGGFIEKCGYGVQVIHRDLIKK